MTARGRFITLEGGEGTGKSTQVARLAAALQARGIATGFGFLSQPATFSIAESWISFVPGRDSYARALAAGDERRARLG